MTRRPVHRSSSWKRRAGNLFKEPWPSSIQLLTRVTVTHSMGDSQIADHLQRLIEPRVRAVRDVLPVVIVTGARQTGKSTLIRRPEVAGDHPYLTLDDLLSQDEARRDPELFLDRGENLIIDEVQHAPDLLLAIKRRVDEKRVPGRYLLTGSSNPLVQRDVSESPGACPGNGVRPGSGRSSWRRVPRTGPGCGRLAAPRERIGRIWPHEEDTPRLLTIWHRRTKGRSGSPATLPPI